MTELKLCMVQYPRGTLMSNSKPSSPLKTTDVSIIRSSAAEYLTLSPPAARGGVEAIYADESIG